MWKTRTEILRYPYPRFQIVGSKMDPISRSCLTPLPTGCTSAATTGGPFLRAPRTRDGQHVPAGLLARGSGASRPPSRRRPGNWPEAVSVALWGKLAAYSCGGSPGIGRNAPSPCSLFSIRRVTSIRNRYTAIQSVAVDLVKHRLGVNTNPQWPVACGAVTRTKRGAEARAAGA